MFRKTISTILAVGIVLSTGTAYAEPTNTSPHEITKIAFDDTISKQINAENMYQTVDELSKEPRAAGTEGELKAVQYISNKFISLGYDTRIQPFPIYDTKVNHVSVKVDGSVASEKPRPFTDSVSKLVTAPLVYVGKAKPNEIGDVKGKIVLIERGDLTYVEKLKNVIDKGAIGVIMYNNTSPGNNFGSVGEGQSIPSVAISQEEGLKIVEKLKNKSLEATIDINQEKIEKTSYNVIASLKPKKENDTNQIVTIGSHHDSVPGGAGANDDASGVSAVLELARIYAKMPIDTEVRFITFGSEERGLVGSSYYAASLPKDEVSRMISHFQMDMIGGRDAGPDKQAGGLIMYTIDGKKNLVTDLAATSAVKIRSEVIPYGQLGRSDHQPFHDLGIPSALFIHSPVEPWYHQPTDTIDKISKDKLQQVAEIVGTSVYQITRLDTSKLPNTKVAEDLVEYPFENRPVD
ncbi:M28 family peptidase [Bacillus sp. JJ722]|uniref:M28 family peptidase n=1 Tax=Bacillus sp. JJ722 TaxID=3122973 RepID=UPI002FFEB974